MCSRPINTLLLIQLGCVGKSIVKHLTGIALTVEVSLRFDLCCTAANVVASTLFHLRSLGTDRKTVLPAVWPQSFLYMMWSHSVVIDCSHSILLPTTLFSQEAYPAFRLLLVYYIWVLSYAACNVHAVSMDRLSENRRGFYFGGHIDCCHNKHSVKELFCLQRSLVKEAPVTRQLKTSSGGGQEREKTGKKNWTRTYQFCNTA